LVSQTCELGDDAVPIPLWPLKALLRSVPDPIHTSVLSRVVNHLLRGQYVARRLDALEGRRLCLAINDTHNRLQFLIRGGRLQRDWSTQPADVTIRGSVEDFLLLATQSEDPDTLFFARRLSLEGETETGLYVKNLLDALEFDGEAHLRDVLGPTLAGRLAPTLSKLQVEQRLKRLGKNLLGTPS